ncbi:MAG: pyridoxamine 5'-phosphate oxidase family protein, partial [Pseudomonadota bacterium]
RLDSLRNIVADGRISVMFMVAGSANVVRVNGTARLTADAELCARFVRGKIQPKSVIVTEIGEVYFQCAKSILRSGLWNAGEVAADVPSAGAFLREVDDVFDAESYDRGYADYADCTKW